jgi:hypothetical protein
MLPPGIRLINLPDYSKIVSGTKAPILFLKENFKVLENRQAAHCILYDCFSAMLTGPDLVYCVFINEAWVSFLEIGGKWIRRSILKVKKEFRHIMPLLFSN